MKYIVFIFSLISFSCSNLKEQEKEKFSKQYPFFKNIIIHNETKTATLNNFESNSKKTGLEYLIDFEGNLIESRNYENDLLNGCTIHYASNKKPMLVAHFKNDTLSGSYFELDTLNGNIEFWSEKMIKHGNVYDNNYVRFTNGRIDLTNSSFYSVKKINDSIVLVSLPCKYPFPFTKVIVEETNNKEYQFNGNEAEIKSRDSVHYYYKIKNRKTKYIVGKASYYRLSKGEDDEGITGRDIYFNIQINQ